MQVSGGGGFVASGMRGTAGLTTCAQVMAKRGEIRTAMPQCSSTFVSSRLGFRTSTIPDAQSIPSERIIYIF